MSGTVKVQVSVRTDKVNSECSQIVEFDREEWDGMTSEQRQKACVEAVWNMAEWNYDVLS